MDTGFDNFTDSAHHNFILFQKKLLTPGYCLKPRWRNMDLLHLIQNGGIIVYPIP